MYMIAEYILTIQSSKMSIVSIRSRENRQVSYPNHDKCETDQMESDTVQRGKPRTSIVTAGSAQGQGGLINQHCFLE